MNRNKFYLMITIIACAAILTVGGLLFNQIYKNHQANELIIEKCFEDFDETGEVVITKENFWSPVICERKE